MGLVGKLQTLILFDIDGTLLRTKGAGREATRLAMLEVFGTCAAVTDHHFGGKTDWQTMVELLTVEGFTEEHIGATMPVYDQAVGRITGSIIKDFEVTACPGAMETVLELRQRDDVLLGIVTGNSSQAAPCKLRAAGFDPAWFPIGAFGSEARERNSLTPLALERATAHLGAPPASVIVIGDTAMDIACARVIDAVAVGVETGFSPREELVASEPDYLLPDLTTFSDVLDNVTMRS